MPMVTQWVQMSLAGFSDSKQNQFDGWNEAPLSQGRLHPTQLTNS